ncbi:MAG TPA: hypothetical protein VK717_09945 [Opitutaceae bacterium]|jgi:hypothetical protein|nr:hypothetical protein [Opitutaceae bacterium]
MRSGQEWLHWLELGAGARWVRRGAILFGLLGLSLVVAWKQFHGPQTEPTLLQAGVGRQLAHGGGFTTLVNYPQTAAVLAARGQRFDPALPYPELHHAPLYSMVIAGMLAVLPDAALFSKQPVPPDGFAADYALLALNLVLLWLAAVLTYVVGKTVFSVRVGAVAALGLLFSMPVWQQTVAVNGLPLPMILALGAFWLLVKTEEKAAAGRVPLGWLGALGVAGGLFFLAEYSVGAVILVFLGYAAWRFEGSSRWRALAVVAAGFALVAAPWVVRNFALTGSPVGLAWQNVALKAGDATAEPATVRATCSTVAPELSLNKLGNKGLMALQDTLRTRLWSGGGLLFTAFFVAGFLYRFRTDKANRLRWIFLAVVAVAVTAQAFLGSGESEWPAGAWLAPLLMIFGAAFFFVLVDSNAALSAWPRAAAAVLLVTQAIPLLHDALEPRRLHFSYPPYYPSVFMAARAELAARGALGHYGLMADVPAGAAWYGGMRVWAQPARLHDFYVVGAEQPLGALLLTPHTLDRPFFGELAAGGAKAGEGSRLGEWAEVYTGLVTGSFPPQFPLRGPVKVADDLIIMLNPALPPRGK